MLATDLVGVAVSFVLDVYPARGKTAVAFWAIWFVLAVFCGLLHYMSAGERLSGEKSLDWTKRPNAGAIGRTVLAGTTLQICTVAMLGYAVFWRFGSEGSYYVPDNMALSLFFLGTVLAATIFSHQLFKSKAA